jgi:hypothetical protein
MARRVVKHGVKCIFVMNQELTQYFGEEPLEEWRPRRKWDFDFERNLKNKSFGNVSFLEAGSFLYDAPLSDSDSRRLPNPLAPE